jgi:hypothetical protein
VFERLSLTGKEGSVVWGYRTAVRLTSWTATKTDKGWTLRGAFIDLDAFQVKQSPLTFAAVRPQGYLTWPVLSLRVEHHVVIAKLGQPVYN